MNIDIDEQISRQKYNEIIQKNINKIANYLDEFMVKNQINPEEIDSLFLTGGTSLVGAVQHLFKTRFPHIKLNSGDNFTSVAEGLAYSGYLFKAAKM